MSVNYTFNGDNVIDLGDFFLLGTQFDRGNYLVAKSDIETLDAADGVADGNVEVASVEDIGAFSNSYAIELETNQFRLGETRENVDDVDGDGLDDFVLGWRYSDTDADFAGTGTLVTTGSLETLDAVDGLDDNLISVDDLLEAPGNYEITGSNSDGLFGGRAGNVDGGDFDGDGTPDMLLGSPGSGEQSTYIINGADYAELDAADGTVDQQINANNISAGSNSYEFVNVEGSVAEFVDFDGDGLDDVVVADGADANDPLTSTYFISAADFAALDAEDGTTDGKIQASNINLGDNSYEGPGGSGSADFGNAGDINGDGAEEFFWRERGNNNEEIHLVDGSQLATIDLLDGAQDGFIDPDNIAPASAASGGGSYTFVNTGKLGGPRDSEQVNVGDVNGDGVGDLLFGEGGKSEAMLVFSDSLDALDALDGIADDHQIDWELIPDNGGYKFVQPSSSKVGSEVATAGDVDNDGLADIFISTNDETHLLLGKDLETHDLADGNDDGVINLDTAIGGPICFVRGTRIKTRRGEIAIEELAPGDMVLTVDHAYRPIRWIGSTSRPAFGKHAPVRIAQGTLGADRDLWVSQQHRIHVSSHQAELYFGENEVLASAKSLVNDRTVTVVEGGEVEYFHMLFDSHEIVWANGVTAESFHPGKSGWSSLEEATRDEILDLFPELRDVGLDAYGETARMCLKTWEGRLLSRAMAAEFSHLENTA